MWTKWLPWRFVLSRLARSRGFIDPINLWSRLHAFAQPSEVAAPIELLRAGVVFHARGLINARAIQHNLDWVWPYWIERQFDPHDDAFVPRAFSITHINLTQRNWTAIGVPDCDWLPIVDPRGLLTPLFDGWSIDAWVVPDEGDPLLPSRAPGAAQHISLDGHFTVRTATEQNGLSLVATAHVEMDQGEPGCHLELHGSADREGWLVLAVRPVNPEGISFVHTIAAAEDGATLHINKREAEHARADVLLDSAPDRLRLSDYRRGDVLQKLHDDDGADHATCAIGLATGAAMYRLGPGAPRAISARIPLRAKVTGAGAGVRRRVMPQRRAPETWVESLTGAATLRVPDERMQSLFDIAVRSLILHAPDAVYPGPYTYRRFWFRDAAYIIDGLLALGLHDRARRAIERFPHSQTVRGYFRSQEGEWDSNGAAIWIIDRFRRLAGEPLSSELIDAVEKGARWIEHKRLSDTLDEPHAGLLPAGFSAEHFGPNDFYYWDDFWSVAGLRCAAAVLHDAGRPEPADRAEAEADRLLTAIDRSLARSAGTRDRPGVPASPYRRMDAAAIGCVVASYPLRLWAPRDERMLETIEFLLANCMVHGGFFQDMMHSGINAYLTLHLAQTMLRAGDERASDLVRTVADLASPTGQWPEAIHPRTGGGCMGDGQHIWAAAEWVLMIRSLFVREEGDRLILASGIPEAWLGDGETLRFGPTPTPFGTIEVDIRCGSEMIDVRWTASWRGEAPTVEVRLPGHDVVEVAGTSGSVQLARRQDAGV